MSDYKRLIDEILACHRSLNDLDGFDNSQIERQFPAATVQNIAIAESRLNCRLPASYREFLQVANGIPKLGLAHGGLLPVGDVDWFRNLNPEWIEAYIAPSRGLEDITETEHRQLPHDTVRFRHAYLCDLLQIGEVYDGSVYLLNPRVTDEVGEWEAWSFANWYPGAARKPSFRALVIEVHSELTREVHIRSLVVDESAVFCKAIPILRERIAEGILPSTAVGEYLVDAERNDEMFAAWARTRQPYFGLLEAMGYEIPKPYRKNPNS